MDMNLKSMNNVYHKASSGVSKISTKFNVGDTKNTISVSEQKLEKSDKVEISSAATQQYEIYKMTKSVMKDIDAIDMNKKIDNIKTQIDNRTYKISPDKIADAILSRWTI